MNKILLQIIEVYTQNYSHKMDSQDLQRPIKIRKPSFHMIYVGFIIILYHKSDYKALKHFYLDHFCIQYKDEFGKLANYSWLIRLKNRFLAYKYSQNSEICFVDSTPIPVCNNLRINTHIVCKKGAERSKSSMGWSC